MALIAGQDFAHSPKTWTSGLYRGNPTPDWYHFEGWPLRWGLGVLQAMTAAHEATMLDTAVEASFMAPGLGPWRPDMVSSSCRIVGNNWCLCYDYSGIARHPTWTNVGIW